MARNTRSLLPGLSGWILALLIAAYAAAILYAMHRPPICTCGTVALWWGNVKSSGNSQHLSDWYSLSHVVHGLLFYFFADLLWRRWRWFGGAPAAWALPIAVAVEASWELLENSPAIIDRYRAVTVSYGYSGDTIVNSMGDIAFMALGFLLAARLAVRTSVALVVALELINLVAIRDNLTLNILMLLHPIEAVRAWQAAPGLVG